MFFKAPNPVNLTQPSAPMQPKLTPMPTPQQMAPESPAQAFPNPPLPQAPFVAEATPAVPTEANPFSPTEAVEPIIDEVVSSVAPTGESLTHSADFAPESVQEAPVTNPYAKPTDYIEPQEAEPEPQINVSETVMEPHEEVLPNGDKVFKAASIKDVNFSDIWYTPEKVAYIRDKSTKFALIPFETNDLEDFYKMLEQGYTGSSSYAGRFKEESYRIERVVTTTGIQYNCRKMPVSTPNLYTLGLPDSITHYLATLATEAGLILFAGPTGMGKTTTASALMKEFLENHGGFLYTIEDPPEMPLDGLYHAKNGALGLCKQSPVENERWEDGLKSALRSRPRYILVGEIRTPEVASQVLRAATSGHLVLSTIHATSVEDALNSMIKYASGAGLDEKLVGDLLARGILAVVHQKLEGTTTLHPVVQTCFANPNPLMPDQMRNAIREGRISLGTLMEAQTTKLIRGVSMFKEMR